MIDRVTVSTGTPGDPPGVWLTFHDGPNQEPVFLSRRLMTVCHQKLNEALEAFEEADREAAEYAASVLGRTEELARAFWAAPCNLPRSELASTARSWSQQAIVDHAMAGGLEIVDNDWARTLEAARIFRGRLEGRNLRSRL